MKSLFLRRLFDNLDVVIAASFIFITSLLFLKYFTPGIFLPYSIINDILPVYLACLLFLYTKFKKINLNKKVEQEYNNNFNKIHIIYICLIIFFICLTISVFILKNSLYYYPISYTYLRIIMALCLLFSIYYLKRTDYKTYYFILFQIIIFALFIRLSPYAIYPTVFGADVWYHLNLADKISQLGSLDGLTYLTYAYYPIMHLLIAAIKIILNVPLMSSLMYSITLCNAISIIFIGIICLKLFEDKKVSLYATFFLAFLGTHVSHSFALVGLSIAFIIVPLLLFLILKRISDKSMNYAILSILLMITLILAHPNSCVMTQVMLVLFCLTLFLFDMVYFNRINQTLFSIPILFITMLIAYWIYISKFLKYLPNMVENFMFKVSGETIVILTKMDISITLTKILGDIVFGTTIFFMVFGLLTVFRQSDKYKNAFFLMASFMFFFGIFCGLIQMGSILPWRWIFYGSIFGMVVFSCGVIEFINLRICRRISFRRIGIALLCIFIILSLGGYDTSCPFFGHKLLTDEDSQVRGIGMSYPELYTSYFVLEHYKQPKIYSDLGFIDFLSRKCFNGTLKYDFADNIENNDYNIDGIFMYRKYMLNNKIWVETKQSREFVVGYMQYKISRNPEKDLENNTNADIIYDTNETKCYKLHIPDKP